jgi:hypothetical protein
MFFSVKQPLKILGKTYVPCVCYPVIKILEATVEHLEKQGKVYVYKEPVSFMNGKVLEKKKAKAEKSKKEKTLKPFFKEIVTEETNESVSSTDTF